MEQALYSVSSLFLSLYGVAALVVVCVGIYWLFNKKARQKQLAELRAKLEQMKPSDPEYGQVRALYTSMMIDAHRWESFHGGSHHSDSGTHSSGDHSGGGGDGH